MLRIVVLIGIVFLAGCDRPAPVARPPTPTPVADKEVEHAIRERLVEQNRAIEQGLANQRAAADGARLNDAIQQRLANEVARRKAEAAKTGH